MIIKMLIFIKSILYKIRDIRNKLLREANDKNNSFIEERNSKYSINGSNNSIVVIKNGIKRELDACEEIEGLKISIEGNGNTITIETPYNFDNFYIEIRKHNFANLSIKRDCKIHDSYILIREGDNQTLNIGINTTSFGFSMVTRGIKNTVTIGDNCLFAQGLIIRQDDGHSIIDSTTNEILNFPPKNFSIGNHCWIGHRVFITKNANIADNTVVGSGSVVTRKFTEEGTVIAGNPAKVIRKNVNWTSKNVFELEAERKEQEILI